MLGEDPQSSTNWIKNKIKPKIVGSLPPKFNIRRLSYFHENMII